MKVAIVVYADDVLLITESELEMNLMLNEVGKQGAKKSLVLVFNKINESCGSFKLNGKHIQLREMKLNILDTH